MVTQRRHVCMGEFCKLKNLARNLSVSRELIDWPFKIENGWNLLFIQLWVNSRAESGHFL